MGMQAYNAAGRFCSAVDDQTNHLHPSTIPALMKSNQIKSNSTQCIVSHGAVTSQNCPVAWDGTRFIGNILAERLLGGLSLGGHPRTAMGVQPPGNSTIRPAGHTPPGPTPPQKAKPQPPVRRLRCHWRSAGPTRMIRPEGPARRPSLTQMPDAWMPIFREPTLDRRFCKAGNKGIPRWAKRVQKLSLCLSRRWLSCVCVSRESVVSLSSSSSSSSSFLSNILSLSVPSLTIIDRSEQGISSVFVLTQHSALYFCPPAACPALPCSRNCRFRHDSRFEAPALPNPNPKPISKKKTKQNFNNRAYIPRHSSSSSGQQDGHDHGLRLPSCRGQRPILFESHPHRDPKSKSQSPKPSQAKRKDWTLHSAAWQLATCRISRLTPSSRATRATD
ncbi:hypothetical protein GGI42DRAFT_305631 [Trichoderma sp. SZMC 28013]